MRCDSCHLEGLHELLILRKDKFTEKGKKAHKDKYHRACLRCVRELCRKGYYDLGSYWSSIVLREKGVF